jgi:hypothetical protein
MKEKLQKKMGRPRKKEGVIVFGDFARAGIVMSMYDEARENGQKHSTAVAQTVELMKQRYPEMRISETEVKRILAEWRPRRGHTILRFERSVLSEEELAKHYWIQDQLAAFPKKEGLKLPATSDVISPKSVMAYKILVGERPNYPRHNRKLPEE